MTDNSFSPMSQTEIQSGVLEILANIIILCEKFGIEYCLIGGGCLGIVRHHNRFVPWDDDLDIAIFAKDIPVFLEAMNLLPDPYKIQPKQQKINPTYKVFDSSTIICLKPDVLNPNLGIFVDVIPMMVWPSNLCKNFDNIVTIVSHDQVSNSPVIWRRFVKNIIYYLRISGIFLHMQKHFFHPIFMEISCFLYKRKIGIISGATGRIWRGKYPWKTIFPLQEEKLEWLTLKVPNDLKNFLRLLYGDDYMNIQDPSKRWNHFHQAYRLWER